MHLPVVCNYLAISARRLYRAPIYSNTAPLFNNFSFHFVTCVGSNCICKYKISAIRYPPFSKSGYGHWLNIEEGRSLIQEVDPILPGLRNRMLSYKYKYKYKYKCKYKNKQINHQTNKQQTNKLDAKRQQDAHVCWFVNSSSWVCSWYCVISSICLLLNLQQEVLMTPAIAAIWC